MHHDSSSQLKVEITPPLVSNFEFSCVMTVHSCEQLWIFVCYDCILKDEWPPRNGSKEPSFIFITTKFVSFIKA